MDKYFKTVLFLVVLAYVQTNVYCTEQTYKLIQQENGFQLILTTNDLKIIQHTTEQPCVFVGSGNTTFSTTEGNVHVEDYVESKVPLDVYDVTEEYSSTIVALSNGRDVKVTLTFTSSETHDVIVSFSPLPTGYDRMWVRLVSTTGEHVYGAGEQFTYFDLKGHKFPIWTREQGIGRDKKSLVKFLADQMPGGYGGDYHNTYFPLPTFCSSRKYYCHVDSSRYMELDFSQPSFHEVMVLGSAERLYFSAAPSMASLVQRLTRFVGTQPELPDWLSEGVILGVQGGMQQVLDILKTTEEHGVPVTGLWIQDWAGKIDTSFGQRVFWNWEWNPERYPGLDKEIIRLRDEKKVRLLAYITPHMNTLGSLYESVKDKDYFMKNEDGETYLMNFGEFMCATVDFTIDEAREWYKGVIKKNLIDFGFGGWMADFSEYIPLDGVFSTGETGATMHSQYPAMWARVNREAVEESDTLQQIFYYMRAGSHGSQKYAVATWAGDQNVDFSYTDGLATTIPAALSLGMCGMGITHFDIGGYTTVVRHGSTENVVLQLNMIRTEELFLRGAEMAIFTPIMRTHEGNVPSLNFQIYQNSESMQRFAKLVEMFKKLSPYTKSLMAENSRSGLPLQRPLFLHYEDDKNTWSIMYQYLYGTELLIAPVLQAGQSTWQVYLPNGDDWVHLFYGTVYKGGQSVTVLAPIGTPPVFYREGSEWKDTFEKVAEVVRGPYKIKTEL